MVSALNIDCLLDLVRRYDQGGTCTLARTATLAAAFVLLVARVILKQTTHDLIGRPDWHPLSLRTLSEELSTPMLISTLR